MSNITLLGYFLKMLALILFFNFVSEVSNYTTTPSKSNYSRVSFWGKVSIAFTILVITCQLLESSIIFSSTTYVNVIEFLPLFIELVILIVSFILLKQKTLNLFMGEQEEKERNHKDYDFSGENKEK